MPYPAPDTTLTLSNSSSSSRGLTGAGTIAIDGGSSLSLTGVDPGPSDQLTISFNGAGGQLWLP
jgi:hypothetical protein